MYLSSAPPNSSHAGELTWRTIRKHPQMGPNTLFEPANTLSADSYCNTPSIRGRSCDVSARERLVASWFEFARAASARRWSTAVVAWKMDFSEGVRESMNSETAEAKGSSFLVLARG